MKKKVILSLLLSIVFVIGTLGSTASAESNASNSTQIGDNAEPLMVNPYRYTKENVKNTTQWSSYKRVSDNLKTGKSGGSITATKSVKFSPVITGSIANISVSTGKSKSSSIGYTLKVSKNSRVYMGYRVKYAVETGTRVRTDVVTGKKVKNKYTVKKPLYGEYKLIKY